jgi:hypothetical protein
MNTYSIELHNLPLRGTINENGPPPDLSEVNDSFFESKQLLEKGVQDLSFDDPPCSSRQVVLVTRPSQRYVFVILPMF